MRPGARTTTSALCYGISLVNRLSVRDERLGEVCEGTSAFVIGDYDCQAVALITIIGDGCDSIVWGVNQCSNITIEIEAVMPIESKLLGDLWILSETLGDGGGIGERGEDHGRDCSEGLC